MRAEATASAQRESDLIRAQTDADVKRIQEAAELTIKNETDKARRALRQDAVEAGQSRGREPEEIRVEQEQAALAEDFLGS